MQNTFSRPLQILETITLARPLIHLRSNSYKLWLEQPVSTQFDINEAWSEASKKPQYKPVATEQQAHHTVASQTIPAIEASSD